MTRLEHIFRRTVCALARPIPLSSPYWTAVMVFLPAGFGFLVIRGAIRALAGNSLVGTFFSDRTLFLVECATVTVTLFLSVSFLARLLQICDPRYFDAYRIEEEK